MKHTCSKCGHEDEINPAKLLASIRTPKKEAAWKANGERLRKMYANARKIEIVPAGLTHPVQYPKSAQSIHEIGIPVATRTPEELGDMVIPPKPTTLEGKKAAAMAALAAATSGSGWAKQAARDLLPDLRNTPCAPFDVNLEGEPHRVTQMGKKLGLFYMGGGEPAFNRFLAEGELEKFWKMRITSE